MVGNTIGGTGLPELLSKAPEQTEAQMFELGRLIARGMTWSDLADWVGAALVEEYREDPCRFQGDWEREHDDNG